MLQNATSLSHFTKSVSRKGYSVIDMPNDGNCAFWAIRLTIEHKEFRQETIKYIPELQQVMLDAEVPS